MIAVVCLAVGTVGGVILGLCISVLAKRRERDERLEDVRKFLGDLQSVQKSKTKFDGTWI